MRHIFLVSSFTIVGIVAVGMFVVREGLFVEKSSQSEPSSPEVNSFVPSRQALRPSRGMQEKETTGENGALPAGGNERSGVLLLDVPFISQAPFGNWQDARAQNGCEEAAILMAAAWGRGETIDPAGAEKNIFALAKVQEETIGHFLDTSARDTSRLMKEYFNYDGVRVENSIAINDIRSELERGNLVIVPVNGRRLGNPFYTPPGPLTHMLVIRGYDYDTKEFITNDPGTKRGTLFRYSEEVLSGALQDYPTGYHELQEAGMTAMIVVEREINIPNP